MNCSLRRSWDPPVIRDKFSLEVSVEFVGGRAGAATYDWRPFSKKWFGQKSECDRLILTIAFFFQRRFEAKLESGELNLSTVTHARTVIRQHEKASETKVSSDDRKSVMLSICGRSKRESERQLAAKFPLITSSVPVRQQEIASGRTRITIEFTQDEMKIFDEIKRLSGRPQSLKDTILRLALNELTRLGKSRGETPVRAKEPSSPPPAVVKKEATLANSRMIPVAIKRSVWAKADGRCEYETLNGDRCEARHALEYEHRIPVSFGGLSEESNLRVFCREHNALSATQILGRQIMARYYPAIE